MELELDAYRSYSGHRRSRVARAPCCPAVFVGSDVEKVEQEEKRADLLLKEISARLERVERLLEEQRSAGKK